MIKSTTILSLSTLFASAIASSSSAYFTLTDVYLMMPSGIKANGQYSFTTTIYDPLTSSTTSCSAIWASTASAPTTWVSSLSPRPILDIFTSLTRRHEDILHWHNIFIHVRRFRFHFWMGHGIETSIYWVSTSSVHWHQQTISFLYWSIAALEKLVLRAVHRPVSRASQTRQFLRLNPDLHLVAVRRGLVMQVLMDRRMDMCTRHPMARLRRWSSRKMKLIEGRICLHSCM